MRNTLRFLAGRAAFLAIALLVDYAARGATPPPEAITAWNSQVASARGRLEAGIQCEPSRFLVVDREATALNKTRSGKILAIHPGGAAVTPVPSGLVHHWTGIVFVPRTRARAVVNALQNYNAYAELYRPAVSKSRLLRHTGNEFFYRLEFQANGFGIKSGLRGDFHSRYVALGPGAGYSITEATRLVELDHPGTEAERELSSEDARGYIQRIFTIVRYREASGGVVVEVESLTLSRDIPASVRWLVAPLVERFAKQVLTSTLDKFREYVSSAAPDLLHTAG